MSKKPSAPKTGNKTPAPEKKGKGPKPEASPTAPTSAVPAPQTPGPEGGPTNAKPAKEPKAKKVSAIDAAAQVLAASKVPMRAFELITVMESKGLWKSPGGKTPEATLYAAIIREIAAKGTKARFKKHERGVFVPGKGA